MLWRTLVTGVDMFVSMRTKKSPLRWTAVGVGLGLAFGVLGLSTAAAQDIDQWNRNKKDCEYVLKAPDRYPLDSAQECTMLWEQYRDTTGLSPDERTLLYTQCDEEDEDDLVLIEGFR